MGNHLINIMLIIILMIMTFVDIDRYVDTHIKY